jgi:hypothetical protein
MPVECVCNEPREQGGNTARVSSHTASADFKKGPLFSSLVRFVRFISCVHDVGFILDVATNGITVSVASVLDTSFPDTWNLTILVISYFPASAHNKSRVCVSTTVLVKLFVPGPVCGLPGRAKFGCSLAADWSCVAGCLAVYLPSELVHNQP